MEVDIELNTELVQDLMREIRVYYRVEGNNGGDWRLWSRSWNLTMVKELLTEAERKYEQARVVKVTELIEEVKL